MRGMILSDLDYALHVNFERSIHSWRHVHCARYNILFFKNAKHIALRTSGLYAKHPATIYRAYPSNSNAGF